MQMYRVKFQFHRQSLVELGEAVVMAESKDMAADMIRAAFNLPVSPTLFEAAKVKPAVYEISRKTVKQDLPSTATFPSTGEDERPRFRVAISAIVRAASERKAAAKVAKAVTTECESGDQSKLASLEIVCEEIGEPTTQSSTEKQAVYSYPKFLQGGAVRPR